MHQHNYCRVHGLISTPKIREYRDQFGKGTFRSEDEAMREILRRRTLPRKGIYAGPVVGIQRCLVRSRSYWLFRVFVLRGHPKAKEKPRYCGCAEGARVEGEGENSE